MLTVSAIAHTAVRVKDIDRSLDFYVQKLGFSEMMRLDRDGRLWLVYLRITDSQYLEIFPDGEGGVAPAPNVVGYHHMCLEVPDIRQAAAELAEAGIATTRPVIKAVDGNWQTWIEDPDGHRIELMQMLPDSLQLEAIRRMASERG